MVLFRRFLITVTLVAFVLSAVSAQTGARREMTVEESYLQESIEIMIIRETARANTRESKLIALDYIRDALGRGSTNDEIRQTLTFLSEEGRRAVTLESGRVINNFPDIRRQSARLLGQMGTEEAQRSLLEILMFENEPSVLQEAIKALGDIGMNENNETVEHIARVIERFDNFNPDNLMALAAIDAFENIAIVNNGLNSTAAVRALFRIIEGNYIAPVKERARQLVADLRQYGS